MPQNTATPMTVNHFSSVSPLLQESNLISVVPTSTVEKAICTGEIAAAKIPLDVNPPQLAMLWHKRQDRDGGLLWLREDLKEIVATEVARQTELLMDCLCSKGKKGGLGRCCGKILFKHCFDD